MRAHLNAPLIVAISILTLIVSATALADVLSPYHPDAINSSAILQPPSWAHPAGTDEVGRDLLARILHGARPSLGVALGIVLIAASGGVLLGCTSGLIGGVVDFVLMRLVDLAMSLPGLVIALALTAALGPSLVNLTIVLGILGIPFYARLARGTTLTLRERAYVRAAKTMGANTWFVMRAHIIPNLVPTIVVFMSLGLSGAMLSASALSFIGLGAQPPLAEWGALINASRSYMLHEWWYAVFPGLAVALAALGFNLLGDGLRDLFDPKEEGA